jgi:transcriptional regulator with XRE-family HTH domain
MRSNRLLRAAVWTAGMSKEIYTPRHEALRKFLRLERMKAELTQAELAERLGWDQTTVSHIETGAKRVTAIELIQLGEALQFDPAAAIRRIAKVRD